MRPHILRTPGLTRPAITVAALMVTALLLLPGTAFADGDGAVCRTPGFWGTHAGTEKPTSSDLTQAVIALGGGVLDICGQTLTNTFLDSPHSAEEALCVAVQGDQRLQLARQLTAAALNCILSGFPGRADCVGILRYQEVFTRCNIFCFVYDSSEFGACIDALGCLNEGGTPAQFGGEFFCADGFCSDNGAACTAGIKGNCANPRKATCVPNLDTCADEPFPFGLFEPPGPAGSSDKCNDAIQNTCEIFDTSCP